MKTISFRDILVCEELSHIKNEIDLLSIENDEVMEKILAACGIDTQYSVLYIPSKHRDMQNKVSIGFMAVGDISINRKFINSPMCSTTERMVAASYTDPSLTRELANLMGGTVNFRSLQEESMDFEGEELPEDMLELDRVAVANQIKQLADLRDMIRGTPYNEAGEIKCFWEYK